MALMKHTCSIVKAGSTTSYSQSLPSWTSGTTTTASVPCLIQPQTVTEGPTGAVIGTHVCYIAWADAPSTLKTFGAEKTHRVTSWAVGGVTKDAGPFDIVRIIDAGGQQHHVELILKRAAG